MRCTRTTASVIFPFLLAMTILTPIAMAQSFPDVPENSPYNGAVEYLKAKSIISGYPDGTFKPDQTINRAEALKMVMVASGTTTGEGAPVTFPDVSPSDWFYDHVQIAVSKGIVEGYEDGTFKPGNNINVAESLKIIFLSFGANVGAPPSGDPYPDVDQLAWYSSYAQYGKERQLIWPEGDGLLHAGRDITRGEFSDIIYRYMYAEEHGLQKFPLATNWPTFIHPTNGYSVKYPFDWSRIEAEGQTIFWKRDEANNQLSWARVFPNSATLVIAVDDNTEGMSLDEYFARIAYGAGATIQSQELNTYPFKSVYLANSNIFDYYFQMPDGKILAVYAEAGNGLNKPQLVEEIRNLVGSIRHHEGAAPQAGVTDKEKFLEPVRANILVEGEAQNMLALFSDMVLIETDSIGIGTGPVDYYYTTEYNVTLKIDRNSNTILALSDEKNTAF